MVTFLKHKQKRSGNALSGVSSKVKKILPEVSDTFLRYVLWRHLQNMSGLLLARESYGETVTLYYPLLLFLLGTNARGDLESTKSDYLGLGTVVKGMGPQVLFFILLVRGKGLRRTVDPTCQQ